jgi:hypothetical protein
LGGYSFNNTEVFDGYMTEVNFVDGSQLTPSSFGQTDAQTGVWQPKAYSGSYGTNGFYLNFSDNSNTTAATLGKDYSGNGNNWTPNNFSVTAGAGNDSLVDSPTSYGTDTGVGGTVRGNYATLNPLDKNPTATASSNGNLDVVLNSGTSPDLANIVGTMAVSSGKWYWELVWTADGGPIVGIWDTVSSGPSRNRSSAFFYGYIFNGSKYNNSTAASYGASYTYGDVIGFALDMDAGTIAFYKNGTSQGTAYSSLAGKTITPAIFMDTGATNAVLSATYNFGQRAFAYTAPSGFKALCTQNLPTPTIGATTATQAGKYYNAVLWTGDNSYPRAITGVGFQPDFVWGKSRSNNYGHILYDAVRGSGATKSLVSNNTNAEGFDSAYTNLSSFNSDGFSLGTSSAFNVMNASGLPYVAWNWKANGSGSTNTAGSITSTVSASTTSGFSVVTYTGTGANATVGHGIGSAVKMLITKRRDAAGPWICGHTGLTSWAYAITFNAAGAQYSAAGDWNSTAPTSTVFSLGNDADVNTSGGTYVAYCFAEIAGYSAFGSYAGNGSADGPFVFCGFRPAFVLVKKSDSGSESWVIVDTTRNTSNVMNSLLRPNIFDAESTATWIDALSNGFKCRETYTGLNASGGTYIYMAFAQNPFKYSLAR